MRLRPVLTIFLLTLGLVAVASAGQAQSSRLYLAGYMGLNMHLENDFSESSTPAGGDYELKNAFSFAGALGLRLTPQWRLEGEISYRNADMDRMDIDGTGAVKMGGEVKTWLALANVYYDFDLNWRNLEPFVGFGVGLASHSAKVIDSTGLTADASDDALGLAWQLGGGIKYRVSPDLAFTGGYRYLGTTSMEIDTYDMDYSSHEIRLGLEYDIPVDLFR